MRGLLLCSLMWVSVASVGMDLATYGVGNFTAYNLGGATADSQMGAGGGLLAAFPLGGKRGRRGSGGKFLEVGTQYVTRSYVSSSGESTTLSYFSVPVLYRYRWKILDMGAGFQLGFPQGVVTTGATSSTYSEAGFAAEDAGLLLVFGIRVPVKRMVLILEGRYNYGIFNASRESSIIARFSDFQILLGVGLVI